MKRNENSDARAWDVQGFYKAKKHVPTKVLTGHSHRVYCLQFSGNTLVRHHLTIALAYVTAHHILTTTCQVSGSDDHSIKVWNIEQARCNNTFIGTPASALTALRSSRSSRAFPPVKVTRERCEPCNSRMTGRWCRARTTRQSRVRRPCAPVLVGVTKWLMTAFVPLSLG